MAKMIQIRHVPDEVHRALVAKADEQGLSLSDYLRAEVTKVWGGATLHGRGPRPDP